MDGSGNHDGKLSKSEFEAKILTEKESLERSLKAATLGEVKHRCFRRGDLKARLGVSTFCFSMYDLSVFVRRIIHTQV